MGMIFKRCAQCGQKKPQAYDVLWFSLSCVAWPGEGPSPMLCAWCTSMMLSWWGNDLLLSPAWLQICLRWIQPTTRQSVEGGPFIRQALAENPVVPLLFLERPDLLSEARGLGVGEERPWI